MEDFAWICRMHGITAASIIEITMYYFVVEERVIN